PGRRYGIHPLGEARERALDGGEDAAGHRLAAAALGDVVLQQALEHLDTVSALSLRSLAGRRQGRREPAGGTLGGILDQGGYGLVAERRRTVPCLQTLLLAGGLRQLAQMAVHLVEALQLPAHALEVRRQLLDVGLDRAEALAPRPGGRVAEGGVEPPLERVEAAVEGREGARRVHVRQRTLDQRR